jgi:IS5 family transposase
MKQSSFSDPEYANKKKTTRRERFLLEMDSIIPWSVLVKPIKRIYPKGHTGRPPIPLEAMLRIYFLQQWYSLSDHGLIVSEGTIVDATIIGASGSTKNKEKKRDPDMKPPRKGNQWYFGMKTHVGTDTNGRVHSVVVTDASVHDSQILDELVHGEEEAVYGDKAYANAEKKEDYEASGVEWPFQPKGESRKEVEHR